MVSVPSAQIFRRQYHGGGRINLAIAVDPPAPRSTSWNPRTVFDRVSNRWAGSAAASLGENLLDGRQARTTSSPPHPNLGKSLTVASQQHASKRATSAAPYYLEAEQPDGEVSITS